MRRRLAVTLAPAHPPGHGHQDAACYACRPHRREGTHHERRRLRHLRRREAGFDEDQAEAAVTMVRDAIGSELATKADLATAIAELKADMLKVAIGIVVANAGLTFAIVKMLA